MNLILEEAYKNTVVGAINTYIRIINEADKMNEMGLNIIDNEWYSYTRDDGKTFVAILKINGQEEEIIFTEKEWRSLNNNMFASKQLQNLQMRFRR